jgi:hypothetical protein
MNAKWHSEKLSTAVCLPLALGLMVIGLSATACAAPRTVVEEHFEIWRQNHVKNYSFVVERSCMPLLCPTLAIVVRDGLTVSVRDEATGQPAVVDADQRWLLTVDSMFDRLKAMRVAPPDDILQVDYDRALGYPIQIRHFPGMTCYDCGTYVWIRDFQRI